MLLRFSLTRKSRHRISRKHSSGLVAGVDDADAQFLAGHQNGRDVSSHQRKDEFDPVSPQDLRHALSSMPGTLTLCLGVTDIDIFRSNATVSVTASTSTSLAQEEKTLRALKE